MPSQSTTPKYPLYILSKGRWESRLTARALEAMHVDYHIIVERQEYREYARVIDPRKVLILDPEFQRKYDPCCALRPDQSKGSGPARNFAWEHAKAAGFKRHWIIDDNIRNFLRLYKQEKVRAQDGTIFRCMEDFCDRYHNIGLAGPNYRFFVSQRAKSPPCVFNTRLYSCILIDNALPLRWRARYNEDVDLSLRVLKLGVCTVQFNAFLQDKMATQTMKGGNTDELYRKGTHAKSEMIVRLHPDVARLAWRFGRMHHYVDYRPFEKNRLIRNPDFERPIDPEYGMRLVRI